MRYYVECMRIGIDASRAFVDNPTGTERYSFEVITRLLTLPGAKKHTWVLYVRDVIPSEVEGSLRALSLVGMTIERIPLPFLWTQVGLAARTWVDKLDVLWVPAHTLPVLRKPGIKTVVTIHGIEYEWLPAYENLLQRWYLPLSTQYAVMSASRIIAVSQFTKNQLVERLGADPNKIQVIYEGVTNTSPSNPSPIIGEGRKGEVLTKWGLKPKQYLLFVGTVQPRKNLVRLIQAYLALSTKHLALKLVIAGKLGWNYEEVVELAKRYGIMIVGYINETDRYSLLQNAIVYVQPSITEGFGLPVLEAMAAGVPVVSSSGGALKEIIGIQYPMSSKILFNPLDVNDMVKKIGLVLGNKKLREEMIKAGLKMKFSWDDAAERTYRTLISK